MRRRRTPLAVTLAASLACNAWAACTRDAPPSGTMAAQVLNLTGRGEARPVASQPWTPAFREQRLPAGADLRTLALSSAAVLLADLTQIRMAAQSELHVCSAGPARTELELSVGRLWARTKEVPGGLQLRTPSAIAGVRGTDWDLEVDVQGRTTLTVFSGVVDLENALGRIEVAAGEQGTVAPGQAPVKRTLVRPRERVQWVAQPLDPTRWLAADGARDLGPARDALVAGRWDEARDLLLARERAGPDDATLQLVLADLDLAALRMDAAADRLARAWERSRDPRLAARRAELLMQQDRGTDARQWLDRTSPIAPASPDLLRADGDWLRLEGRGREAVARYREALSHAKTAAERAEASWALGRALQERGTWREARSLLAQAAALAPSNATYRGEAATAAAEGLRLADARAGFDAALALASDDYVSLAGAGFLALQQSRTEAGRELLLKALTLEPRHARAQVWLAEAEYTLGRRAAAFDALEKARFADPNDPLPWQVESVLLNDSGEPARAIAAAREALLRLPFVKSLNPLATDAQGSSNLGKALGDFGLEHWARAYALASYDPLWAGSHFFLADRYESDFNRRSELFQGYLADPTVFGASEKRAPLFLATGSEWSADLGVDQSALRRNAVADAGWRGFTASALPLAWLVRVTDVQTWPREGPPTSQYRLSSPTLDLAFGVRPTEGLSLFLLHDTSRDRTHWPDGLDFGNGITVHDVMRTRTSRTDAGASLRWNADQQTWLKVHRASQAQGLLLDDARFGPQDYGFTSRERGEFLRHTASGAAWRWSAGWERIVRDTHSAISDAQVASPRDVAERYAMPWFAGEWRSAPWTFSGELYRPRLSASETNRFTDPAGVDLLAPSTYGARQAGRVLQRWGASFALGPGRALHAAYQESLRAPGTHTLAPVATGAIPVDNQYMLAGSFARKKALQFDWEADPATFFSAAASSQTIANAVAGDSGQLFAQRTGTLFDRVTTIAPIALSAQASLATYQENPVFEQGRIRLATLGVDRILARRWSVLAGWQYAATRNTGATYAGNELPGFPRHTAYAQTTWRHEERSFSLAALAWRSRRFADEANAVERPAGWSLGLAHAWESRDRRWRLTASAQHAFQRGERPALYLFARYRDGAAP